MYNNQNLEICPAAPPAPSPYDRIPALDVGLRMFIAYHEPKLLSEVDAPSDAIRVDLNHLDLPSRINDPSIAESRLLLSMSLDPGHWLDGVDYVALFHASYNTKFAGIPPLWALPAMAQNRLDPDAVVCPVTSVNILGQADQHHHGMSLPLARIMRRVNIPVQTGRPGPMTNSFIAHSNVWRRFLSDYPRMYLAAVDELATINWDTRKCKPGVAGAYLMERLTTIWFAAQPDLTCYTISNRDSTHYVTNEPPLEIANAGTSLQSTEVTVNAKS